MTIIYKKNCPICNSELQTISQPIKHIFNCNNKCYSLVIQFVGTDAIVYIYDDVYRIVNRKLLTVEQKNIKDEIESKIKNSINYWKENDRYLAKILEGE